MKRTLSLIALIVFALALALAAGCGGGKTEQVADGTAQHKCAKCGMEMAAKDMVETDGVWYCPNCAPAEGDAPEGDAHEGDAPEGDAAEGDAPDHG